MQKILVTGANGFVGTMLCSALSAAGHAVRRTVRARETNTPPTDTIVVGELGAATVWTQALSGIDTVVHLAARTHVMHDTATDPRAEYRRVNVLGTQSLALAARSAGVRRFIFASSIKVNGEETGAGAFTESHTPQPRDAYGQSKWEAEQALWQIAQGSALEGTVLRPPTLYGPGVKGNFLSLLRAVDRGLPLPLASVRNRRSLLYVGNLVDAISLCLTHPEVAGKTYLVADDVGISTPDMIRDIGLALDKPARLFPCPEAVLRLVGMAVGKSASVARMTGSLQVDSTKIRDELGWRPPYVRAYGLRQTAGWYHRRHNAGT